MISHLRIFGCIVYAYIPIERGKNLMINEKKYIFLGICDYSKAYKIYNSNTIKFVISQDIIFYKI
jgi:hypothetical protein